MGLPLNPALRATFAPPVMEARRWLAETALPDGMALLNVSQAAPVAPPPIALRSAIADAAVSQDQAHLYGPVLGNPDLRAELAYQWSNAYGGTIMAADVAITQGCNQAFCAALATIAGPGDEVILPTPWYFNHKMWCDLNGVRTVPLPCGPGMLPDPATCADLIGPRTRAIVLVSPNNPTGAEYPATALAAFADLARTHDLALIVDETYRDFDARSGRPHDLFTDPDWRDVLVHLYSFSKAYRLTGHRVGAIVAAPARLAEIEKFLDTVAICAGQLGQIAALWGLRNLGSWVQGERAQILARRAAITTHAPLAPGWRVLGAGAYFAWVEHPFAAPSDQLAREILARTGILMLPGTMFTPPGDVTGLRAMRIAFANIDADQIREMFARLGTLDLAHRI